MQPKLTYPSANLFTTQGIAHLRDYPDPNFVETLIAISTYSAALIGYEGPKATMQHPNHKSAISHIDKIDACIESELSKCRIDGNDLEPGHGTR